MQKFKGELIGSTIEIIGSKNKTLVGLKGIVVDETKNMIIINNKGTKKILKSHITFKVDGKIIEGKQIQKRPEDRIKK